MKQSYDTSVFIDGAIREVYKTLAIALGLAVLVIFLFLWSARSTEKKNWSSPQGAYRFRDVRQDLAGLDKSQQRQ